LIDCRLRIFQRANVKNQLAIMDTANHRYGQLAKGECQLMHWIAGRGVGAWRNRQAFTGKSL
jgi:hypothetical protein